MTDTPPVPPAPPVEMDEATGDVAWHPEAPPPPPIGLDPPVIEGPPSADVVMAAVMAAVFSDRPFYTCLHCHTLVVDRGGVFVDSSDVDNAVCPGDTGLHEVL